MGSKILPKRSRLGEARLARVPDRDCKAIGKPLASTQHIVSNVFHRVSGEIYVTVRLESRDRTVCTGRLLEYAVLAEQAGFDSISASDHFHPWSEIGQACFVWTWLGAAAAKTRKIALGTGVTCPILRYHPAIVAQAAATLASLAPGRSFSRYWNRRSFERILSHRSMARL